MATKVFSIRIDGGNLEILQRAAAARAMSPPAYARMLLEKGLLADLLQLRDEEAAAKISKPAAYKINSPLLAREAHKRQQYLTDKHHCELIDRAAKAGADIDQLVAMGAEVRALHPMMDETGRLAVKLGRARKEHQMCPCGPHQEACESLEAQLQRRVDLLKKFQADKAVRSAQAARPAA